jgi:hypothetical protein
MYAHIPMHIEVAATWLLDEMTLVLDFLFFL